jgi:twinkle protein
MNFIDFGINVSGTGTEQRAICPRCSHERKKSKDKCLSVNTIEGVWHCFNCNWSGNLKPKDYRPVKYEKSNLPDTVINYFKSRCISADILEQENIGFEKKHGKGWIKFPYFYNGDVVNIKYRSGTKEFRQEKDAKKCFYRHDKAIESEQTTLVITEGEFDTLACLECGYESVSIPDGAPQANSKNLDKKFDFFKDSVKIFNKFSKFIIAGDNDGPGKRLTAELGLRLGVEKCKIVEYPEGCKDCNDILVNLGKAGLKTALIKSKPFPVKGIISPMDTLDDVMIEKEQGVRGGESTGWSELDRYYTVRTGEMTIVTGIPSHGKSSFIDSLCCNLLNSGFKFGMFSPENIPVKRHTISLIQKLTGETLEEMKPETVKWWMENINNKFKFIAPPDEDMDVDNILKYVKILCFQYGIKGLVLDPWNEFDHNFKSLTETQYVSENLSKIRRFARLYNLHIWVIAHPTKQRKIESGENKGNYNPPGLYDISGGANWYNKADNGLTVFRDMQNGNVKICVTKIRFKEIGKIGHVVMNYKEPGIYECVSKTYGI